MTEQERIAILEQQNAALAAALEKLDRVVRDIIFVTDSDSAARIGYDALHEAFPSGYREILSAHDAAVRKPLLEENHKLRKIAAFVPADVYIRAKEEAGYGDSVKAHEPTRYNDDGSERK